MAKLHLVMPMAGRGGRFFENGFVMPKPLIEINGRPFFYWATQSIAKFVDCADITFVVLEEHIRDHAIDREIKTYYPDAKIVALPEVTEGAAITALRGAESLPDDEPLLFNDCDHLFLCKPFNEFCKAGDFCQRPGRRTADLCQRLPGLQLPAIWGRRQGVPHGGKAGRQP